MCYHTPDLALLYTCSIIEAGCWIFNHVSGATYELPTFYLDRSEQDRKSICIFLYKLNFNVYAHTKWRLGEPSARLNWQQHSAMFENDIFRYQLDRRTADDDRRNVYEHLKKNTMCIYAYIEYASTVWIISTIQTAIILSFKEIVFRSSKDNTSANRHINHHPFITWHLNVTPMNVQPAIRSCVYV